jgi:SAM-dependent methyltransferase
MRLGSRDPFPPGGTDLYGHVALLAGVGQGCEILDVGCGSGVSLEYFVRSHGAQGSGVDPDPALVARATARTINAGLQDEVQFQQAPIDTLPYRDEVFDVVIGELPLTAWADAETVVAELVRVTRHRGCVVLIQPVWTRPLAEPRRSTLVGKLGVRPLTRPEWKRILREAGVGDLHTEDWSNDQTAFRQDVRTPLPDLSKVYTLPERLVLMRRAWARWGWSGARSTLVLGAELRRAMVKERLLGLELMVGTKVGSMSIAANPPDPEADMSLFRSSQDPRPARTRIVRPAVTGSPGPRPTAAVRPERGADEDEDGARKSAEVSGLPLFAAEGKPSE